MNDLRIAAQQALEALEGWDNYGKWAWPVSALKQAKRNTTDAITALQAALAEPSGSHRGEHELSDTKELIERLRAAAWAGPIPCPVCDEAADTIARLEAERDELRAALEQPEPEPVAADPTDPGYDVTVLREQVRHLERRIRQLAQPEPVIDRAMAVRIATQLGWAPPSQEPEHKPHCALLQIPSRECDCVEEPAQEPVAWRNPATDDVVSAGRRKEWESGRYGLAAQGSTARFTQPLCDCRAALAQPEPELVNIGSEWTPCVKLPVTVHVREQKPGETHVSTREGITPVKPDDLIMRGVSGEEYPIGREIFERTYQFGEAPQRKPLTEEEIYKIYYELWRNTEAVDFARAIEQAHNIKE